MKKALLSALLILVPFLSLANSIYDNATTQEPTPQAQWSAYCSTTGWEGYIGGDGAYSHVGASQQCLTNADYNNPYTNHYYTQH